MKGHAAISSKAKVHTPSYCKLHRPLKTSRGGERMREIRAAMTHTPGSLALSRTHRPIKRKRLETMIVAAIFETSHEPGFIWGFVLVSPLTPCYWKPVLLGRVHTSSPGFRSPERQAHSPASIIFYHCPSWDEDGTFKSWQCLSDGIEREKEITEPSECGEIDLWWGRTQSRDGWWKVEVAVDA